MHVGGAVFATSDAGLNFWFGPLTSQQERYTANVYEQEKLLQRWCEDYLATFKLTPYDPRTHGCYFYSSRDEIVANRPYMIRQHRSARTYGDVFKDWLRWGFCPNERADTITRRARDRK